MMKRGWTILMGAALATALVSPASAQTTSRSLISCQKKFIAQVSALTRFSARRLQGCTDKIAKCKLAAAIDGVDATDCLVKAGTSCGKVGPALANAIAKRQANIVKVCGAIPIGDLEQFIGGLGFLDVSAACGSLGPPLSPIAVTDAASLADCVLTTTECAVEREVYLRDPRALDSLTEVGQTATFPCVGS